MIEKEVTVETADGPMAVAIRHPDGGGPFPVVVVFHDGPGLRADIHDVARRVAAAGYYAVLPDLYHRIGPTIAFDMAGIAQGPGSPEFERLMAAVGSLDDDEVLADTAALLAVTAEDPAAGDGVKAAIGFCVGARLMFRLLAADTDGFAAGAAMHPSFCVTDEPDSPHRSVGDIAADLFVGFGAADTLAPLALNEPLRDELARARATVEIYDGADHGFMFPNLPAYDEQAATASWDRTLELFRRVLV
ncbi:dienelactone hydrolase family protein [Pseudonocardia sp. N23]|uniref:dienelactone hydrolase family protein n=1 Tax=Pseudonocardia sp. N23 TaxID=1987376 RepID=UPI000C029677|nr:dienelactone hydrolase family protein [Pseudonocardia sp. N23]GAY11976.1 dienelactone hydrolase family [Pseudonocardia sp. N23]